MTESFQQEIFYSDLRFSTVRCFHQRQGESAACATPRFSHRPTDGLGTTYLAEPVCEDSNATIPLEVHVVRFESDYYSTNQGRMQPINQTPNNTVPQG
jgi:translation initiation factor 2-alpha kinase 4